MKTCGVFTYKRFCDQSGPYSRTGILEKGIELRVSGLCTFFKTPKLKQKLKVKVTTTDEQVKDYIISFTFTITK